ncbi:hypothetical protein B0H11DRAFT_2259699 [Mycena galericulata]|nr:hypothetical protein B0H11DRAFT_2259699 [Mycena galericulata]
MSDPDPPPPTYQDSHVDTLLLGLSQLALDPSHSTAASSSSPPTPSPADPIPVPILNAQIDDSNRSSPPMRTSPLNTESPRKKKKKLAAYAVFYGRRAGVYTEWFGPAGAEAQVRGVPYSLYQGYATASQAQAAFEYAHQRSWVSSPSNASSPSIPTLPIPQAPRSLMSNPLHGGILVPKWHIVYAGINPGIYPSYLECALNTLGLPSAEYESAATLEEAEARWHEATRTGRTRVLTHSY